MNGDLPASKGQYPVCLPISYRSLTIPGGNRAHAAIKPGHSIGVGEFMLAVASRRSQLGMLLATVLGVSISPAAGQSYTPEQEQA